MHISFLTKVVSPMVRSMIYVFVFLFASLESVYIERYNTIDNGGISFIENSNDPSIAQLDLPIDSTILYAELIWSGSYGFPQTSRLPPEPDVCLTFKTPRGKTHSIIADPSTSQKVVLPRYTYSGHYVRSADITSLVQTAGTGRYTVEGENLPSKWTLAVVYHNPHEQTHNMTLMVGCEQSSYGTNLPAKFEGLCTPSSGNLSGKLWISSVDATANALLLGEQLPLQGASLLFLRENASSSADISPLLQHSQTSLYVLGTTAGQEYTLNALGLQIQEDAPNLEITPEYTFDGDTVFFKTLIKNIGTKDALSLFFQDSIDNGLVFVPGSLTINNQKTQADPKAGIPIRSLGVGRTVRVEYRASIVRTLKKRKVFYHSICVPYDFLNCDYRKIHGETKTPVQSIDIKKIAKDPHQPLSYDPPKEFIGKVKKNKTDISLEATWAPVESPALVSYRIYRNNHVVAEIPAGKPLVFSKHLKLKKAAYGFSIVAVYENSIESSPVQISIVEEIKNFDFGITNTGLGIGMKF